MLVKMIAQISRHKIFLRSIFCSWAIFELNKKFIAQAPLIEMNKQILTSDTSVVENNSIVGIITKVENLPNGANPVDAANFMIS